MGGCQEYMENEQKQATNESESRAMKPERETRGQSDKERAPDFHNRRTEREGRSEWSGGSFGGGVWGGRREHER